MSDEDRKRELISNIWRLTMSLGRKREEPRPPSPEEHEEERESEAPRQISQEWVEYVVRQTLLTTRTLATDFTEYPTRAMTEAERKLFIQGYLWAIHVLWEAFMLDGGGESD